MKTHGSLLVLLFLIQFMPHLSKASPTCTDIFLAPETEIFLHGSEEAFGDVEFFNRNNNVGLQYRGTLTFKKWGNINYFERNGVPFYSVVGLNKTGTLYHVVGVGHRTLARKLSGATNVVDFKATNHGRILIQDSSGKHYLHSEGVWKQPLRKKMIKRFSVIWGVTSLGAITLIEVIGTLSSNPMPELKITFNTFLGEQSISMLHAGLVVLSGLSSLFPQLSLYQNLNSNPSGLSPIPNEDVKHWMSLQMDPLNPPRFSPPSPSSLTPEMPAGLSSELHE